MTLRPLALAAAFAFGLPAQAQDLTITATFGPTAEVPDPCAGYNGWMSNQMGVTESLMAIGYDLDPVAASGRRYRTGRPDHMARQA